MGVRSITASKAAFAATTVQCHIDARETGLNVAVKTGVVAWGDPGKGGQSDAASDQLVDVRQIACTGYLLLQANDFSLSQDFT